MLVELDAGANAARTITLEQMETYMMFRTMLPKPTHEEAHLRHILRFYIARSFAKGSYDAVYILPELTLDGEPLSVDVAATDGDQVMVAICEPESITPDTIKRLERLESAENAQAIVVYSQYGSDAGIADRFSDTFASRKFRLTAVVPPPFDDVYEYDIWMFETTFRNVLEDDN